MEFLPFINMCIKLHDQCSELCSNQDQWARLLAAGGDKLVNVVYHSGESQDRQTTNVIRFKYFSTRELTMCLLSTL